MSRLLAYFPEYPKYLCPHKVYFLACWFWLTIANARLTEGWLFRHKTSRGRRLSRCKMNILHQSFYKVINKWWIHEFGGITASWLTPSWGTGVQLSVQSCLIKCPRAKHLTPCCSGGEAPAGTSVRATLMKKTSFSPFLLSSFLTAGVVKTSPAAVRWFQPVSAKISLFKMCKTTQNTSGFCSGLRTLSCTSWLCACSGCLFSLLAR